MIKHVNILEQLNNPYVSGLHEFLLDDSNFYIIMEHSNCGNILFYMNNKVKQEKSTILFENQAKELGL